MRYLIRFLRWCINCIDCLFLPLDVVLGRMSDPPFDRPRPIEQPDTASILAAARARVGPQKGPLSMAQILAQARQSHREYSNTTCNTAWTRADPVNDVLAAKERIDNDIGYTFDGIPLRGPVKASVTTAMGGVRSAEVTIHRLPDRTQLVFATPMTVDDGETLCLTFAPVEVPAGRWNWYGNDDANFDAEGSRAAAAHVGEESSSSL